MTHPPIPTNCPHFEFEEHWWFRWPRGTMTALTDAKDERTSIIAAVARCAWLDAARQLSDDTFERKETWRLSVRRLMREQWTLEMAAEDIAIKAIEDQELDMKRNAEAWREWGLK